MTIRRSFLSTFKRNSNPASLSNARKFNSQRCTIYCSFDNPSHLSAISLVTVGCTPEEHSTCSQSLRNGERRREGTRGNRKIGACFFRKNERVRGLCFKVERGAGACVLPEVDEEQGWEEALADEGAGGWSAVGGVGGEFVEFPRISPACFSTWYMASTSAHTRHTEIPTATSHEVLSFLSARF